MNLVAVSNHAPHWTPDQLRAESDPPASRIQPSSHATASARARLSISYSPDVSLDRASLDLSRLQCRIAAVLLSQPGPVSTRLIAEYAWQGRIVSEHTVHSQMNLLRTRLAQHGIALRNLRGSGYYLE
jgi:DNA-binding response OmpR family regulator